MYLLRTLCFLVVLSSGIYFIFVKGRKRKVMFRTVITPETLRKPFNYKLKDVASVRQRKKRRRKRRSYQVYLLRKILCAASGSRTHELQGAGWML